MQLTADGDLVLKGCIVPPFCKSQTWTRAASPAPAAALSPAKGRGQP